MDVLTGLWCPFSRACEVQPIYTSEWADIYLLDFANENVEQSNLTVRTLFAH